MANHLSVTKSNAIGKLHQQGQSQRQIAEALNVDPKTVRRHLAAGQPLSDGQPDSKGATAPTGSDQRCRTPFPLPQLIEMDEINPRIDNIDVAIVIGANDVVNPAAREDENSPI